MRKLDVPTLNKKPSLVKQKTMEFEEIHRKASKSTLMTKQEESSSERRNDGVQAPEVVRYGIRPNMSKYNNSVNAVSQLPARQSSTMVQPQSPATVVFSNPSRATSSVVSSSSSNKRTLRTRISNSKIGQLFSHSQRSTTPLLDQKLQAFQEERLFDERKSAKDAKDGGRDQPRRPSWTSKFGLSMEPKEKGGNSTKQVREVRETTDRSSAGMRRVVYEEKKYSFDEEDEDRMRSEDGKGIIGVSVVIHRTNRDDLIIRTPFVVD